MNIASLQLICRVWLITVDRTEKKALMILRTAEHPPDYALQWTIVRVINLHKFAR